MATRVTGDLYESLTGQLFEIGRQLRQQNGYPFDPTDLQRHLQDAIEGRFANIFRREYGIVVNYDLSVEDAVKAGLYDEINHHITSTNFPSSRHGCAGLNIILIRYNNCTRSAKVSANFEEEGLRAAEAAEIFAFGTQYPNVRLGRIIALGSRWCSPTNSYFSPCLCADEHQRKLTLEWHGNLWNLNDWFAAVRR